MDASKTTGKFITNVGLITSRGPLGDNIMSAEWTYKIAYDPYLILISIDVGCLTCRNIRESRAFGVSIAAGDQNVLASLAGNHSGEHLDKISLLKELGFRFYPAATIDTLMVADASMNAECKVRDVIETGSAYCLFVGEVQDISEKEKEPLIYYSGSFRKLGDVLQKPGPQALERMASLIERYRRTV